MTEHKRNMQDFIIAKIWWTLQGEGMVNVIIILPLAGIYSLSCMRLFSSYQGRYQRFCGFKYWFMHWWFLGYVLVLLLIMDMDGNDLFSEYGDNW